MTQVRNQLIHSTGAEAAPSPPAHLPKLRPLEACAIVPARLTRRERECLAWCADGKSYWETAVILGISPRTVSFHMEAVRSKLEAASNAHAVARAIRAGLLGPCVHPGGQPRRGLR